MHLISKAGQEGAENARERFGGMGKGSDRTSIRLRPDDVEAINAVKVNPCTIAVFIRASTVFMEEWRAKVPALLFSWYSGCEGGHALADVLLGRIDASGRLPYSIPRSEAHLPYFDKDASSSTYDRWFGPRLLDKLQVEAAFLSDMACPIRHSDCVNSRCCRPQIRQALKLGSKSRILAHMLADSQSRCTADQPGLDKTSLLGYF